MKQKIGLVILAMAFALLSAVMVPGQQPPPPDRPDQPQGPPEPQDPLRDVMFPPEMIMQHQRELRLTDQQKTFMRAEINKTSTRFNELQWQLQDDMEALHETMKGNTVNEQLALSQLDKVLDGERAIKRLHMEMALRIKNQLTPEQQMKLQEMRRGLNGPHRGPGHGPGRGPSGPGSGPGGPGPNGPPPDGPGGLGRPGGPTGAPGDRPNF
jgi:Spy/CpxP family protein refolding chaperone